MVMPNPFNSWVYAQKFNELISRIAIVLWRLMEIVMPQDYTDEKGQLLFLGTWVMKVSEFESPWPDQKSIKGARILQVRCLLLTKGGA